MSSWTHPFTIIYCLSFPFNEWIEWVRVYLIDVSRDKTLLEVHYKQLLCGHNQGIGIKNNNIRLGNRKKKKKRNVKSLFEMSRSLLPQSFRFIDEWTFLAFGKQFPFGTKPFRYFGIVHLWIILCHLSSLAAWPHHKCIHWTFYVIGLVFHDYLRHYSRWNFQKWSMKSGKWITNVFFA